MGLRQVRLRPDVEVVQDPQHPDKFLLKHPATNLRARVDTEEAAILFCLDGSTDAADIASASSEAVGAEITVERVEAFAAELEKLGLLERVQLSPDPWEVPVVVAEAPPPDAPVEVTVSDCAVAQEPFVGSESVVSGKGPAAPELVEDARGSEPTDDEAAPAVLETSDECPPSEGTSVVEAAPSASHGTETREDPEAPAERTVSDSTPADDIALATEAASVEEEPVALPAREPRDEYDFQTEAATSGDEEPPAVEPEFPQAETGALPVAQAAEPATAVEDVPAAQTDGDSLRATLELRLHAHAEALNSAEARLSQTLKRQQEQDEQMTCRIGDLEARNAGLQAALERLEEVIAREREIRLGVEASLERTEAERARIERQLKDAEGALESLRADGTQQANSDRTAGYCGRLPFQDITSTNHW